MKNSRLNGVEDTLFIPLIARIEISKKFSDFFYDKKAISIENNLSALKILENSSEYTMLASVSRYYVMDNIIRELIENRQIANIVTIGCGLETMAWRIDKDVQFYQIDFPQVIEQRREILGTLNNECLIAGDINEIDLTEHIKTKLPTLFVVAGVFQYFHEPEVLKLINKLKREFTDGYLLFDATDEYGIKYAQKYVQKTGNQSANMHFFINDAEEFTNKSGIELLLARGFYKEARKQLGRRLKLFTRIAMAVTDWKRRTIILLCKLN